MEELTKIENLSTVNQIKRGQQSMSCYLLLPCSWVGVVQRRPMRDRGDYGELDIPACDPHAVPNLLHQIILGQILFVDIPAPTCQLIQFQCLLTMI